MNTPATDRTTLRDRPWPEADLEHLGACPVCGHAGRGVMHEGLWDNAFFAAPGTWTMWRCGGCRSGYLDPRPSPASIGRAYSVYYTHAAGEQAPPSTLRQRISASLGNGYRNGRYGTRSSPASPLGYLLARAVPPLRWLTDISYRHLPRPPRDRPGRVLDIGCGDGAFLTLARGAGWEAFGAEPDPVAQATARAAGHDVRLGGAEAWADAPESFDVVTMSHVIEHVHSPPETLRAVLRLLRPGGTLFIDTPDIDAPGHRTYGPNWRGLEVPRHLAIFNDGSLRAALAREGFTDIRRVVRFQPTGWLAEASERMAAGLDPNGPDSKLGVGRENMARRIRAALDPSRREFLTVTCRRPA